MEIEIFKDVKGYEGIYQISNLGNVKSLDHYIKTRGGNKAIKMYAYLYAKGLAYVKRC